MSPREYNIQYPPNKNLVLCLNTTINRDLMVRDYDERLYRLLGYFDDFDLGDLDDMPLGLMDYEI